MILLFLLSVVTKHDRHQKAKIHNIHQEEVMDLPNAQSQIRNNTSVMVSLPRQSQNEETITYLQRIIDSARTVRVTHVSKYARYGRETIGWLFIPQPDYKNMIGFFRLVLKKGEYCY